MVKTMMTSPKSVMARVLPTPARARGGGGEYREAASATSRLVVPVTGSPKTVGR